MKRLSHYLESRIEIHKMSRLRKRSGVDYECDVKKGALSRLQA
uniref:Uncharacterized protein n=1 Tax=Lepeophtheirus salmonis TaxID=72036 RepID=A0A0K2VAV6_LEPSM